MRPREEVLGSRIPRGATQNSKSPHRGGLDVETTRSRGGDVLSAHPWAHRIATEGNRGGGTEAGYPPVEIERSPRSRLIAGCAKIRIAARPWLRRRRNRNGDPEDRAYLTIYLSNCTRGFPRQHDTRGMRGGGVLTRLYLGSIINQGVVMI